MAATASSIEYACSHCGATNRIPAARIFDDPVCGGCKEKLFPRRPVQVTDATFAREVETSPIPVLVDFWAPWCGPCKMVAPILDKLAKEYAGKMVVAKVNTDENPEWAGKFGVQGIPTMLFVSGGKVVHRQVGALPERMLRDVISQFMEVASAN